MKSYDVVIVGAGGAGLMTAQLIAKEGYKVALIERKKDLMDLSFSTLGSFMDIRRYGLSKKVIASNITTGDFHSKSVSFTKQAYNVNILDKKQIHRELIENCNNLGVEIVKGSNIVECKFNENESIAQIVTDEGDAYSGKVFADCSGTAGVLSRKAGLQDRKLKTGLGVEYNVHYTGDPHKAVFLLGGTISGGYGWIFPLGNERAIVGFASMNEDVIRNIRSAFQNVLNDKRVKGLITIDNEKMYGGSIPITDVKTEFVKNNLICVGDSVSQVNPMVGEGYTFIFDAATMASRAIIESLETDDPDKLSKYEEEWKQKYESHYNYSKFLQQVLVKATTHDFTTDIGMLFLKSKRSSTINKIISGSFGLKELVFP